MFPPAVETGVFELTAFWSLNAAPAAIWLVSAFCTPSWKPPAPPHPATHCVFMSRPSQPHHRSPRFWCSDWSWSVFALFETSADAFDVAVCVALLGPEETFPPAIETGTFAFTAFWSLFAIPRAPWLVSALWTPAWKPPAPPQPARHEPPPMFWLRCWSWSVFALFETSAAALDVAVCVALLGPEETFPPAIETGTFAFTAFWSLFAIPTASWLVWASWIPAWNPPAPPQPSLHEPPPMF